MDTDSVTVTVEANSDPVAMKDYSFDGGTTWQTSKQKTFTSCQTYVDIMARDTNNNTCTVTLTYVNMDKNNPIIECIENTVNKNGVPVVIVTAKDEKSGIKDYITSALKGRF